MSIVHDLLTNINYGEPETATLYTNLTLAKTRRLREIADTLAALADGGEAPSDDALGDVDLATELADEFAQISESLNPVTFTLRPVGPIALAAVQELHDAAVIKAQVEVQRFQDDPSVPLNQNLVMDGLPLMLNARLAAATIVEPATTPQQWLALLEKFGAAGMAELVAAKERCLGVVEGDVVPKLPATLDRTPS